MCNLKEGQQVTKLHALERYLIQVKSGGNFDAMNDIMHIECRNLNVVLAVYSGEQIKCSPGDNAKVVQSST